MGTPGCITRSAISVPGLIFGLWSACHGVGSGRKGPGTCCRGLCRVHVLLLVKLISFLVRVLVISWVSVNGIFLDVRNPLGPRYINRSNGPVQLIVPGRLLTTRSRWRQVPPFGEFLRM